FQDGTAGTWQGGGQLTRPNASSVVTDGGPTGAGDHYLQINSSLNDINAAPRLLAISSVPATEWTGDFIHAGVTAVSMDLLNPNPSTALTMRIAFRDDTTNSSPAYVTDNADAVTLPPNSGWTHVTFQINSSVMTTVGAPGDFNTFLENVKEFRIVDSVTPTFMGDQFTSNMFFDVDNIMAVPEPSAFILSAMALSALFATRRKRRS
ncbi:MAG TPA: PEP-CTERM sorting domain-containing protein, partial [Pirellulales bacterium]